MRHQLVLFVQWNGIAERYATVDVTATKKPRMVANDGASARIDQLLLRQRFEIQINKILLVTCQEQPVRRQRVHAESIVQILWAVSKLWDTAADLMTQRRAGQRKDSLRVGLNLMHHLALTDPKRRIFLHRRAEVAGHVAGLICSPYELLVGVELHRRQSAWYVWARNCSQLQVFSLGMADVEDVLLENWKVREKEEKS